MNPLIEQKKAALQNEIDFAESLLETNLNNLSMSNYMPEPSHVAQASFTRLLDDPLNTITKIDALVRNLFSKESKIRQVFKYLALLANGIKILRK